jgi:hypothetical protein
MGHFVYLIPCNLILLFLGYSCFFILSLHRYVGTHQFTCASTLFETGLTTTEKEHTRSLSTTE